ncbi:MAG TPA: DeoR/GlpR family DNA-binding transcription regulator [Caulobacteraceae bacterium]
MRDRRFEEMSVHGSERERVILDLLGPRGFVSFQDLDAKLGVSPATIRRDLERMAGEGLLKRVRGGARATAHEPPPAKGGLQGVPFHENLGRNSAEKQAIGRAAAALCRPAEAVMIDGGSTTLQMCPHLDGLKLHVLTNSLHIVSALLNQVGTQVLVPGGAVFREQNIILSAAGDECIPRFHAPRLFMGAAAIGPQGLMQADVVLIGAERQLIDRADEIIILVDSSKFRGPSGHVVSDLAEVDIVVTDAGVSDADRRMLEAAGVRLVVAEA